MVLIAGAAGLLLWWAMSAREPGKTAQITYSGGKITLPLGQNTVRHVAGLNGLTVTVAVRDGAVYFQDSGCPDKLCVSAGRMDTAGQGMTCLPAGVTVTVTGDKSSRIDTYVGTLPFLAKRVSR